MSSLWITIPATLCLAGALLALVLRAARRGDYDDWEGPAARALYDDPEILVFDEGTSALDAATEAEVMAAVERLHGEKTMILVAHRLGTVAHCDRVVVMDDGAIKAIGSFDDVVAEDGHA